MGEDATRLNGAVYPEDATEILPVVDDLDDADIDAITVRTDLDDELDVDDGLDDELDDDLGDELDDDLEDELDDDLEDELEDEVPADVEDNRAADVHDDLDAKANVTSVKSLETPDTPETPNVQVPETPGPETQDDDVPSANAVTSSAETPSWAARLRAAASRRLHTLARALLVLLGLLVLAALKRLPGLAKALRPRLGRLSATIIAGLLLCASFPPTTWWWAAVVTFALLAWVLTRPATTLIGGLGYGFLFGLVFYVPLLPWISDLVGLVPWITLGTVSALFPALFGLLAVVVGQLRGWPIWFAVLWTAQEWLKSSVPFGGFPWGVVGFGQTNGPFLPLVRLGGVPLLSGAIVLLGCSATAIALEIVAWWPHGRHGYLGRHLHRDPAKSASSRVDDKPSADQASPAEAPPAVVLPGICMSVVLLLTIIVWPPVHHAGAGSGNEPLVTVAAVQGNVPRLGLDFNAQRRAVLDNHVQETLRLAEDVHAGRAAQPQFVIWPEDSSDVDPLLNADAAQQISVATQAIDTPILVGTVLEVTDRLPDDPAYTNTVIVWNPVAGPSDRHDKQIIQPFGEYLPWPWLFRHLSEYADRAGRMVPGVGTGVVHVAGIPVGVATCWEIIFDRAGRQSVLNGAQLLAVPTNNATFDKTMSEQQLVFAKVRAVELDRYVVVAGTTGISAVIAPDGRELARTDFFQPAYLDTQVRLKTTLTPAMRWGPILQWVLIGLGVAVVATAMRHNGWLNRLNGWLKGPQRLRFWTANKPGTPEGGPIDDTPLDDDPPDEGDLTVDDPALAKSDLTTPLPDQTRLTAADTRPRKGAT